MRKTIVLPDWPVPEGYIAWHDWAARQAKRGDVQEKCGLCAKFRFPVELTKRVIVSRPRDSQGRVHESKSPVCRFCDPKAEPMRPDVVTRLPRRAGGKRRG